MSRKSRAPRARLAAPATTIFASPAPVSTSVSAEPTATTAAASSGLDEAVAASGTPSPADHPRAPQPGDETTASSACREPIGYVTACPALLPHPDVAPGDGEIQRLYILRGHQGGGRGTALLRTALEWLERDGPRTLWIGVWSENYGAQRFYARHGFEVVGEYSFMVGDHADREFITRCPSR